METSPVIHPVTPLIAFLQSSPADAHFAGSAVPTAQYHALRKSFCYHMRKRDHAMYPTDYIPVHTFHNNTGVFFRNRMLLNHVQLVTGCNPRRTLLHNCYRSSLSCPILYLFSWLQLLLKSTNTHLSNPLLDLLHHMLTLLNLSSSLSVVFVFCSVSS